MIKTVYLDMDGVLVNFLGGLHKALDVPYSYENYPYEKGKWDMLTDIPIGKWDEELGHDEHYTFEQCNDCCDMVFWVDLNWMHDGHEILRAILDEFNTSLIYLLTTPMPNLESASGKMMWVNDNLPVYLKRTIITQAPKHLLARPDTVLFDDKDENVNKFRKAGGQAILINRPWNAGHGRANNTVEDFKNELEEMLSL